MVKGLEGGRRGSGSPLGSTAVIQASDTNIFLHQEVGSAAHTKEESIHLEFLELQSIRPELHGSLTDFQSARPSVHRDPLAGPGTGRLLSQSLSYWDRYLHYRAT